MLNPLTNPLETKYFARYKSRIPDPGLCKLMSIDFEERRVSMSNGSNRYFPTFDEIEIVDVAPIEEPVEPEPGNPPYP